MKIDPTFKPSQVNPAKRTQLADDTNGASDFAKVLGTSMQQKAAGRVERSQIVPSVAGPDVRIQNDIQPEEWRAADGMLDALDAYRYQLSNPKATLKMVEPYIDKMSDLLKRNQPILDQLTERNPVKQVLQQAMVHISKEIERFRMGYYVDG